MNQGIEGSSIFLGPNINKCLKRRGGEIIKGIRDATGAKINILPLEELPTCGLANDRVVQCGLFFCNFFLIFFFCKIWLLFDLSCFYGLYIDWHNMDYIVPKSDFTS